VSGELVVEPMQANIIQVLTAVSGFTYAVLNSLQGMEMLDSVKDWIASSY
jgi:hypothetical protein